MIADKPIKIGFDAKRIVSNATGLGNYGRTLVNALSEADEADRLLLYAPGRGREELVKQVQLRDNVFFVYPQPYGGLNPLRMLTSKGSLWRSRGILRDLRRDGVELYHGLSGELPVGISRLGIKTVLTVHDLIFLRHPEYYNPVDVQLYKLKFRLSLREATRIVAISECTKRDILAFGNYPEQNIDVIYQSCGKGFTERATADQCRQVKQHYHLPDDFILQVGTIERRKNALLAVKALQALPANLHLVLIGRSTDYERTLKKYAGSHGVLSRLHILHGVPTSHLYAIYQQAACFAYPSRYEGFGLPVIEAIQSGLPVVAATGSCLEEAGGEHCIYVQPDDVKAFAGAVKALLPGAPNRAERIALSQQYVARFENNDTALRMLQEYARVLSN